MDECTDKKCRIGKKLPSMERVPEVQRRNGSFLTGGNSKHSQDRELGPSGIIAEGLRTVD